MLRSNDIKLLLNNIYIEIDIYLNTDYNIEDLFLQKSSVLNIM